MNTAALTESTVESPAFTWLEASGWRIVYGVEITLDALLAERQDYGEIVLAQWLCDTLLPKRIFGKIRVKDAERFSKERAL